MPRRPPARAPSAFTLVLLVLSTAWTLACAGIFGGKDGGPGLFEDHDVDGDGFAFANDCDDQNPHVNPDAVERCDLADVDEDCNGRADNLDDAPTGTIEVHRDADDDGYGVEEVTLLCEVVEGYTTDDDDCDDTDDEVHPGADEVCGGGDEDCDGEEGDEDDDVEPDGFVDLWEDGDGDGWGDTPADPGCGAGEGRAEQDGDCDDDDAGTNPGADEACGGGDEDCDGTIDEDDATDAPTWYADADGDGYGDTSEDRVACEAPPDFVGDDTDCDDDDDDVHPDADETCDDDDEDCDGEVDEDTVGTPTWYEDADEDGYGDRSTGRVSCDAPAGTVSSGTDCDDTDDAVSPGHSERCDSADTDEDCDGATDDDDPSTLYAGRTAYYADDDGDGYGDPAIEYRLCDPLDGYVTDDTDCDDGAAPAHPGGTEVCDARDLDEDCDGDADDDDAGVSATTRSTWYLDADADGFGGSTPSLSRCDAPTGYVASATDCDDAAPARSPGRPEVCDAANVDEDCDALADDDDPSAGSSGKTTWYADADADGYGDADVTLARCDAPVAYVSASTDCDDADLDVNPGVEEVCFDGVDDDCDGATRCEIGFDDAERTLLGDDRYTALVGASVASAGDIDGDGIDDLLVGAPEDPEVGTSAGKAYLALGGGTSDAHLRTDARATWRGEATYSYAGQAVAGGRDYDGDGIPEVVIGVYRDNDGAYEAGAAFVFSGATTGRVAISSASAWAQLRGEGSEHRAGQVLAPAGDVDGDGREDLLVGAPGRNEYTGRSYLVTTVGAGSASLSTATANFNGESAYDYAALAVHGAGDIDGDGFGDLVFGALGDDDAGSDAGAAYLVFGPVTGTTTLASADAKLTGVAAGDEAGCAVSGGGDVDGDGYDDLVVGATGGGTYGAAYLVLGPVSGTSSLAGADARMDGTIGRLGSAVAVDGDLDGDGHADVAVANNTESTYTGSVSVFLGPLAGTYAATSADVYVRGGAVYDQAGSALAYVGSQAGVPGMNDLLVGALGDDTAGASGAGAVYVYSASGF